MRAPLAAQEHGSGEPLVLLHGWGLNAAVWHGCAQKLGTRSRVIAIDLPGHGRSPWSEALRSFEHQTEWIAASLPPGKFSLLGWSLGGLFAMRLAAILGNRVHRLILVATTPKFVVAPDWPAGLSLDSMRKFALQLATNYRGTVNDFLELQTRGSANAGPSLAQLRAALRERGDAKPEALRAGLDILEHSDLRPELASIVTPALLISGQYDRIAPAAAMSAVDGMLADSQHVTIARAAHAVFLSHLAMFATKVAAFLDNRA